MYEKRKAESGKRELFAAIARAVEQYYRSEKNVAEFKAWREARIARKHDEEAKKAC